MVLPPSFPTPILSLAAKKFRWKREKCCPGEVRGETAVLTLIIALFYSPIKYWLDLTASRWNKNQMSNRNRCPGIRSTERSDIQFLINFKNYTASIAERSCCLSRNCLELNIKHHTQFLLLDTENISIIIFIIKKCKILPIFPEVGSLFKVSNVQRSW